MATEHVEEYGRGEKMDGGWGSSSPARFYATCSWRPWGDKEVLSSTQDAASSGDVWGKSAESDVWDQASKSAADGWGQASESTGDGWGQASAGDGWGQASESAGDGWNPAAESPRGGWCELDDPYCEFEEPRESDSIRKVCFPFLLLGMFFPLPAHIHAFSDHLRHAIGIFQRVCIHNLSAPAFSQLAEANNLACAASMLFVHACAYARQKYLANVCRWICIFCADWPDLHVCAHANLLP